jgi:predicted O-linked N-acetylglucosamine transferase (SPINDLY family)
VSQEKTPLAEGIKLQLAGRLDEAERIFAATARAPETVESLHRLALVYVQRGAPQRALPLLEAARTLAPDPRILYNCAIVYGALKRPLDAVAALRDAIAAEPHYLQCYATLADHLVALGDKTGLASVLAALLQRALEMNAEDYVALAIDKMIAHGAEPEDPVFLANRTRITGREDAARRLLARRLAATERDFGALLTNAIAHLRIVYASEAEIAERREKYASELNHISRLVAHAADEECKSAHGVVGMAKPFLLAYHGENDRALQAVYGGIVARIMSAGDRMRVPAPRSGSRIRVGFVTRYFFTHSVSKLFAGWIKHLDRARFEVVGYHLGADQDATSRRIAATADVWRSGELADDVWAETLALDAPHVLIYPELGMDTSAIRLACRRIAPVQCVSWGHPVTTGLPHIDYFLSSDLMEPADGQDHYNETLVRLPNLSIAYEPVLPLGQKLTRSEIGASDDDVLFICCQSLFKYLPRYDEVFVRIAERVPRSRFLFIGDERAPPTKVFRQRLEQAFRAAGRDPSRHVLIVPHIPFDKFAAFLALGDVYLDSIGWSGGNTSLEALSQGLPIVTLPTGLMRGRHTKAILEMMGCGDLIAGSIDDYVAKAALLANPDAARAARRRIEERHHALIGDLTPVRALEGFLERAVAKALEGAPAAINAASRAA